MLVDHSTQACTHVRRLQVVVSEKSEQPGDSLNASCLIQMSCARTRPSVKWAWHGHALHFAQCTS